MVCKLFSIGLSGVDGTGARGIIVPRCVHMLNASDIDLFCFSAKKNVYTCINI